MRLYTITAVLPAGVIVGCKCPGCSPCNVILDYLPNFVRKDHSNRNKNTTVEQYYLLPKSDFPSSIRNIPISPLQTKLSDSLEGHDYIYYNRKNQKTYQYWPQEFRTIQYCLLFSEPHPTMLIPWLCELFRYCGASHMMPPE